MTIVETSGFKEDFENLNPTIKKKYIKQVKFLASDFGHPSLKAKKIKGLNDVWEARIDYHYRFSFQKIKDTVYLLTIGPHDEALGKK